MGGFNVHYTQSVEAAHKESVKLAANRSRHLHVIKTLRNMSSYLTHHVVFEHLRALSLTDKSTIEREGEDDSSSREDGNETSSSEDSVRYGVSFPLLNDDDSEVQMGHPTSRCTTRAFQSSLIHREVLLTRGELLDSMCDKLRLPKTLETYKILHLVKHRFGQKLTQSDGHTFWGTDIQYVFANVTTTDR